MKTTLATLKSFIRTNRPDLLIRVKSSFDGRTDCCEYDRNADFFPAEAGATFPENTLGIPGVWLVGGGRDRVSPLAEPGYRGLHVYNCCGSFDVAVADAAALPKILLTRENAPTVKTIRSITNPEWGVVRFNYNDQDLPEGEKASTFGTGSNSAVLFEGEYHFWEVIS